MLCFLLQKIRGYMKNFGDTKTMSFLTKYEEVMLKCNKIWSKVKSVIKRNNSIVTQYLMTNI